MADPGPTGVGSEVQSSDQPDAPGHSGAADETFGGATSREFDLMVPSYDDPVESSSLSDNGTAVPPRKPEASPPRERQEGPGLNVADAGQGGFRPAARATTDLADPAVSALADELTEVLAVGDSERFAELFDRRRFIDRVLAGWPSAERHDTIRANLEASDLTERIVQEIVGADANDAPSRIVGLGLRMREDGPRPVVRLDRPEPESSTWLELVVDRSEPDRPRVVDFDWAGLGQTSSDTVRFALLHQLDDPLSPSQASQAFTRLQAVARGQALGRFQDVLAAIESLDEPYRSMRPIAMARLEAYRHTDPERYRAYLTELDAARPNDPALAIQRFHLAKAERRWTDAEAALDSLDRLYSPDGWLVMQRSELVLQQGDIDAAARWAEQAYDIDPDNQDAALESLDFAIAAQDHQRTLRWLKVLAARFDADFADLATVPQYHAFVQSDEYRQFQAFLAETRRESGSGSESTAEQ